MEKAKLFVNGGSQAVRLPAEFRFDGNEVYISRDPTSGSVILTPIHQNSWELFFASYDAADIPSDFLADRDQDQIEKDLF